MTTPITNKYCLITGSIASVSPIYGFAFATQQVTFQTEALQNPSCSDFPIAPSTVTIVTDTHGTLPAGFQLQQGAHVNMLVGTSQPISIIVPCQSTADIGAIILSQTDPPEVVSAVNLVGPLAAGATVINPDVGQIGTSTITFPNTQYQTGNGTLTIDCATGNVQAVTVTGDVAITLANMLDGQSLILITIQANSGGHFIGFGAPGGLSLYWSGAFSTKPTDITTDNTYTIWTFTRIGVVILGDFICTAAISTGGTPPPPSSGTVTSVAVTVDSSLFAMSGNPISVAGTIAAALKNQGINLVLAGPTSGADGTPTFRSLVANDIPTLDIAKIATGIFPVARGGTGSPSLAAHQLLVGGANVSTIGTGTAGQVMTSNGASADPSMQDLGVNLPDAAEATFAISQATGESNTEIIEHPYVHANTINDITVRFIIKGNTGGGGKPATGGTQTTFRIERTVTHNLGAIQMVTTFLTTTNVGPGISTYTGTLTIQYK